MVKFRWFLSHLFFINKIITIWVIFCSCMFCICYNNIKRRSLKQKILKFFQLTNKLWLMLSKISLFSQNKAILNQFQSLPCLISLSLGCSLFHIARSIINYFFLLAKAHFLSWVGSRSSFNKVFLLVIIIVVVGWTSFCYVRYRHFFIYKLCHDVFFDICTVHQRFIWAMPLMIWFKSCFWSSFWICCCLRRVWCIVSILQSHHLLFFT